MSLKKTGNIFILGIFLGVIGIISSFVLSCMDKLTKEPIKAMQMKKINEALKEVLPEFTNQPSENTCVVKSADDKQYEVKFYGAKKNGKLVAVAGKSYTLKGYSGRIEAIVGMNINGSIRTVIITKQNETPGLGTVFCDRVNRLTIFQLLGLKKRPDADKLPPNPYLDQFNGHIAGKKSEGSNGTTWDAGVWKVRKDGGGVNYITGATISSRAVTDVVYRIAETFMADKKRIIQQLAKLKDSEAENEEASPPEPQIKK